MNLSEHDRIRSDKKIAYFMGWRIDNSFPDKGRVWRLGNNLELETTFKFTTDYEVLMSVVEKIESLNYSFLIKESYVIVFSKLDESTNGYYIEISSPTIMSKRLAIYLAVTEFCRKHFESLNNDLIL